MLSIYSATNSKYSTLIAFARMPGGPLLCYGLAYQLYVAEEIIGMSKKLQYFIKRRPIVLRCLVLELQDERTIFFQTFLNALKKRKLAFHNNNKLL